MNGDDRARQRERNRQFDEEVKAAKQLLEQVGRYVGRSQVCQAADFEDLCSIHHAIGSLFERVKRFTSSEAMPRVYGHNGVKAALASRAPANLGDLERFGPGTFQPGFEEPITAAVELPTSDAMEVADEAAALEEPAMPAPLFDLVRQVPDVSMEELCRHVDVGSQGLSHARALRPVSSSRGPRRRKAPGSMKLVKSPSSQTSSRPVSSNRVRGATAEGGARALPPAAELMVEVSLEFNDDSHVPPGLLMQEMRVELQVVELPSRTPMRSLRITNKPGRVGTVMLEVHSLKRAELCMALVKDTHHKPNWDESGELSMLSPGGNDEAAAGRANADVSSALRVPVSQLLTACSTGASLEWEADGARTIVVQGKMLKGGQAVEYFPGNLQAVPESAAQKPPTQPSTPAAAAAGRGASAVETLRHQDVGHEPAVPSRGGNSELGPFPPLRGPNQENEELSDLQMSVYSKLSHPSSPSLGAEAELGLVRPGTAPHPPTGPAPRNPRPQPRQEEASAVSRYVGRLLRRGSTQLVDRARKLQPGR